MHGKVPSSDENFAVRHGCFLFPVSCFLLGNTMGRYERERSMFGHGWPPFEMEMNLYGTVGGFVDARCV